VVSTRGATMNSKEQNYCNECEKQLSECKDSKCKQCEEDKKVAFLSIEKLEKKIFALTVVMVIAITLIGKEFADKIVDIFSGVEQINDKVESFEIPKENKEGETREVSTIHDFSSSWFS
jgi:hypothetical protein